MFFVFSATRCICLFTLLLFQQAALAQSQSVYIRVGDASIKRSLLAMPEFVYLGTPVASGQGLGADLFGVVYNDLVASDFFSFINPRAFLENTSKMSLRPQTEDPHGFSFESWQKIGAELLLRGGYQVQGAEIVFDGYLYSVKQAKLIFAKKYRGPVSAARRVAHTFANDIFEKLSGKKGYFLTKIVASSNKPGGGHKEIVVMDWDGFNSRQVTEHKTISLSPAWSPNGKSIAYTAFAYHPNLRMRNTDLFRLDLDTGKRWLISFRRGINSGASFIPASQNLLATLSKEGNPDIYEITRDGEIVKQLTHGPTGAMNVEAVASPDGKQIAFSSDRGGRPRIYLMNRDGSNVRPLTSLGRYIASPAWSPDGAKIAYAGQDEAGDHFDIFIMPAAGGKIERLTSARRRNGKWADNEDPSFSPDGSRIMFVSNRSGHNEIYMINTDGTSERQITYDRFDYFRPKWSPYLQ